MQRTITIQKRTVPYTLHKSKRAKRVRLTVHCDGAVVLTAPHYLPERFAERFLRDKKEWLIEKLSYFRRWGGARPQPLPRGAYALYKEQARELVLQRIAHFNRFYGHAFGRVSIRDQKTRWGSCSRKKTLSFNWRLALLPSHLADYVVVHELCHLKHFDHSANFWTLMERAIPDANRRKRELRAVAIR